MTVINTANSAPCGNYSSTAVSSSKHFGKTLGMHVFMAFGGRPDGRQCLIFESHRYMCSRVLAITMGCKGGAKGVQSRMEEPEQEKKQYLHLSGAEE